jgi:mRNA interferase YafQ
MRTIKYTNRFKQDFKREKKSGRHKKTLEIDLVEITNHLASDKIPLAHHCDHALSGNWKDHRDCHIKPDLILIYRKPDKKSLELIRLGSHNQLGL